MSKTEKHYLNIGDSYYVSADGTLYYIEPIIKNGEITGQTETAIANHSPILKEQRLTDNGIEQIEELVFTVRRNFQMSTDTAITLKEILSQNPNIKFGAACRIYLGRGYKSRYSEAMQIQCENAPRSTVYQHTGFTIIDGERVFLNGENSVTTNGLISDYRVEMPQDLNNYSFTEDKHPERYETFKSLLNLKAPEKLILSSLGFAFLTPLNGLLRGLGLEPCFLFYLVGRSGSHKTTWAKLMLNFFGNFVSAAKSPASFQDTVNSIGMKLALTDCVLMLVDDRIPDSTQKIQSDYEQKEQKLSRLIGDRAGRGRMTSNITLAKTYIPKCNLIITAEQAYSNIGESAIARSISVEMTPDCIDLKALSDIQLNAVHLNECMIEYIQFLLQNWEDLSERLKPLFYELRSKAQNGGHGRLAECVAHLQIGISVMCAWLVSVGVFDDKQAAALKRRSWSAFMEMSVEQNRRITEEKPTKLFIDAIREMKARDAIKFTEIVDNNAAESPFAVGRKMGYHDSEFYYCHPDIYAEVRKFYQLEGKNFPLNRNSLFKQLAAEHLILSGKAQTTKSKRIGEKTPRLLWIYAAAIDTEEEKDE